MTFEDLAGRLGRIEDKLEIVTKLSACMESIAEKIKYMDQVSKERIGLLEQDVRVLKVEVTDMKQRCTTQTAKCPALKVSKFEWLIFGTCITTMGALVVALSVAYMQLQNVPAPLIGG